MSDKITDTRNGARPNSARATGTRSSGGTSLACDNLAGWPTTPRLVHFVTYQIDSSSAVVAGTQLDCSGIVSGNTIGSITVIDGSDTGNSIGDVVEMLPTAAWGQDLADALTSTHNRSGGLKSGLVIATPTITNPTITIPVITDFTSANHTHATTAQGGAISNVLMSNPYKFSVYRNSALSSGSGADALVAFDTKRFDTGSNVDVVTNKGRFTAPIAGFYLLSSSVGTTGGGSTTVVLTWYKNGVAFLVGSTTVAAGYRPSMSEVFSLAANDYIEVFCNGGGTAISVGATNNSFSGFLVSAT